MTPPIVPPATHETELGKQLADAAVAAGVQHIVFSGLENVEKITRGTKFAPHFTDKARVEEYIRTLPRVTGKKAAYISTFTREGLLHSFPQFGANELLVRELRGMVEYAVEYGYFRQDRDLPWSRRVNPGSASWEQFLCASGWQGQQQSFGD